MWSLVSGLATAVFCTLTYTLPGPFNPLLFFITVTAAALFGFAVSYDLGRWKKERERDASQPRRDETPHATNA